MTKQYDERIVNLWDEQELEISYPMEGITTEERVVGAIIGALIGDALALGYQWNYDYKTMWERYGTWVTEYVDPLAVKDGKGMDEISNFRHEAGVRAGMSSQTGQLIQVLLETVAANAKKNGTGEFVNEEYIAAINNFFEHDLLTKARFAPKQDIYITRPGTAGTYISWLLAKKGYSVITIEKDKRESVGNRLDVIHFETDRIEKAGIPPFKVGEPDCIEIRDTSIVGTPDLTTEIKIRALQTIVRLTPFLNRMYKVLESDGVKLEFSCLFKKSLYQDGKIIGVVAEKDGIERETLQFIIAESEPERVTFRGNNSSKASNGQQMDSDGKP